MTAVLADLLRRRRRCCPIFPQNRFGDSDQDAIHRFDRTLWLDTRHECSHYVLSLKRPRNVTGRTIGMATTATILHADLDAF
jgi:hypothetical protein